MKIRVDSLRKSYRRREVVRGVSFDFEQGEVVGLLGPNGAGKTTTFYMVTGLVRPNGGEVYFDDQRVTQWPMYKRARAGVGYLAQESSVFRRLSVEDNLLLVLETTKLNRKERLDRVHRLAGELQIERLLKSQAAVLSGGERRRVEIARALATEPHFILLDEPFTGIDPVTIEELQGIIRTLTKRGIGVLITDHNINATLEITDRNYILIGGEIVASGDGESIRQDPLVRKHYLGEGFKLSEFERAQAAPSEPTP